MYTGLINNSRKDLSYRQIRSYGIINISKLFWGKHKEKMSVYKTQFNLETLRLELFCGVTRDY